jgi:hypothetical protein
VVNEITKMTVTGGLVNAFAAAHTNTFVDLYNIALNDTVYFQAAHPVTISNTGSVAQTYSFANLIAATAYTLNSGAMSPGPFGHFDRRLWRHYSL